MAASAKVIARVRKLRRLQASNNQHEAARAKEEADALMRKHHISEEDIADVVVQEADAQRDAYREFLATLAAKFFNCVMVGKKTAVGFRGTPRDVKRALTFYQSAIAESEGSLMPPVAAHLRDAALDVWKFCWWDAFVATIYERFGRPTVDPKKSIVTTEVKLEGSENPLADVLEGISKLDGAIDVYWLKHEAKKSGRSAGHRITFPTDIVEQMLLAAAPLVEET